MARPMGRYSVDWSLFTLEELQRHVEDLKAVGKTPPAALVRALYAARENDGDRGGRHGDILDAADPDGR